MLFKFLSLLFIFSYFQIIVNAQIQVGLILKKGDERQGMIVEQVLKPGRRNANINLVKQVVVNEEDTVSYHRALCQLLTSGIDVLISPSASPYYPLLSAYAREYQIPFITPELPQEISLFSTNYSFGIKPATDRPMLKLFQHYGWSDIVYLYDHDDGPENLNFIFTVGRHVLNLTLDGILRVTSAEKANKYLRKLDKSFKNKRFHVVLDTDSNLARDIIWLHVNDIHVRKKNFHFLLSKPTLEEFWYSQRASFGAINVTTFLIENQLPEAEVLLRQTISGNEIILNISSYYYYDAALLVQKSASFLTRSDFRKYRIDVPSQVEPSLNCFEAPPRPRPKSLELSRTIEKINIKGATGKIMFQNGKRKDYFLNITEVTPRGFQRVAFWSNGNLHPENLSRRNLPTALPLIQGQNKLQIVTLINAPYMMLKSEINGSILQGNDRFEGFCKDMLDLLAKQMDFEYDLHVVADGTYGIYDKSQGQWTGIVGELIQGKADLAVADLIITGKRQRVIEFTDPYEMVGFSLLMKNPLTVTNGSNILFFLSAFTTDVWICILFAVILFCVLFHFITRFTGAPDSIESASGIWGRKHTAVVNVWFTVGSSLLQGTGVYPRSISSRILSGFCWFFTLVFSAMFIASVAAQIMTRRLSDERNPQLSQIKSLSLESIIAESVSRGWPKIGLVKPSNTANFMKKSTLPIYIEFAKYLENNPEVTVSTAAEGVKRVRESNGNYMALLGCLAADYAARRKPCDLIVTPHSIHYAAFGLATPQGSHLSSDLKTALHIIQHQGALAELHKKWWMDSNECGNTVMEEKKERTVYVFSGLLCVLTAGCVIVLAVFAIQYVRRNQTKENRRQQLSFEDMNLGQPLPTPPPELLAEPPPVLNLPEYDKKTLL